MHHQQALASTIGHKISPFILLFNQHALILQPMNGISHRRKWMSRILLAVFVPMLMLSALHVHTVGTNIDDGCSECMHHVRHSHLSTADFCIGQCVLCQFQTLPFIAAILTAICIPMMVRHHLGHAIVHLCPVRLTGQISLRAPPSVDMI